MKSTSNEYIAYPRTISASTTTIAIGNAAITSLLFTVPPKGTVCTSHIPEPFIPAYPSFLPTLLSRLGPKATDLEAFLSPLKLCFSFPPISTCRNTSIYLACLRERSSKRWMSSTEKSYCRQCNTLQVEGVLYISSPSQDCSAFNGFDTVSNHQLARSTVYQPSLQSTDSDFLIPSFPIGHSAISFGGDRQALDRSRFCFRIFVFLIIERGDFL